MFTEERGCLWEAYDKGGFAVFLSVCCRFLLSAAGNFSLPFVSGSCLALHLLRYSFLLDGFYVFEYLPTVCKCPMCLPDAQGDQKTGSDPWELELRTVVCYCVSAGN